MIKSLGDAETELIWNGQQSKKLPVARRKLRMINNAQSINDLRVPPANHLEKLPGFQKAYYSIRVNKQYRVVFIWSDDNAYEVEITDYH